MAFPVQLLTSINKDNDLAANLRTLAPLAASPFSSEAGFDVPNY